MNLMLRDKIKAFAEVDYTSAERSLEQLVKDHIKRESKEYILGVDEEEYKNYIVNEYSLEPLVIHLESETVDKPLVRKEKCFNSNKQGQSDEIEIYSFTINYKFSGTPELFRIGPSDLYLEYCHVDVDNSNQVISFSFLIVGQDVERFKIEKESTFNLAFANIEGANNFANNWNLKLIGLVDDLFKLTKNKFLKENDFFTAINISINAQTQSVFTVPTIKKAIIPKPIIEKGKEFSSEPTIAKKMYSDILKVIYEAGKSMEKKPSLYKGKDEEALRDQFLLLLETRYESVTATGETFNKKGKTDIILKYSEDNSNVFVAECKFWKGANEFNKAINQLFDRYLTWRDSKVALIFFVTNNDFTKVLATADEQCAKHEYFVSRNGSNGDSSLSYKFRLPNDKDKEVFLELILFHFDEK